MRVHRLPTQGALVTSDDATTDLIGTAAWSGVEVLVVPVARMDPAFLDLSSGFAGELLGRAVNYRLTVALLGDVSDALGRSRALRDLVEESNRGRHAWFAADEVQLDVLLARHGPHMVAGRR